MAADTDDIRARLETIADEIADLAMDALRQQLAGEAGKEEERRLLRARRAVEKAIVILGSAAGAWDEE